MAVEPHTTSEATNSAELSPQTDSRESQLVAPLSASAPIQAGWRIVIVLAILGVLALLVDAQLCSKLVHEQVLRKWSGILEDVELLGHAIIIVLVLGGLVVASPSRRWTIPRVAACAAGGGMLANLLKMTIARARPYENPNGAPFYASFRAVFPGITAGSAGQSFPSAHAATAVALAASLAVLFPKARWYFLLIAALVGFERVEVGSHFLSDTLWGSAAGYAVYLCFFGQTSLSAWFDRQELRWSGAETPSTAEIEQEPQAEELDTEANSELPCVLPLRPVASVSIVVPMYNERDNVNRLYDALLPTLTSLRLPFEIVLIDDGSTDGTTTLLRELASRDTRVKLIQFRRNFGQTAAMNAGLHHATGDAIVLMDGDLQNDPTDIPMMLAKLEQGYDLVHGWRKNRHDRFLDRRLPSMIANRIISKTTGFPVNDLGCTLKVLRREIARDMHLYGEMHRFIPILAHYRGARCVEVVTKHHPRRFGTSKYGLSRTVRVMLDLLTVKFLTQYFVSPMKLFGNLGLASVGVGVLAGLLTIGMKLISGVDMTGNPLLLGSVFSAMLGTQFFCLGALGEVAVRTYFESQDRTSYAIRNLVNFEAEAPRSRVA